MKFFITVLAVVALSIVVGLVTQLYVKSSALAEVERVTGVNNRLLIWEAEDRLRREAEDRLAADEAKRKAVEDVLETLAEEKRQLRAAGDRLISAEKKMSEYRRKIRDAQAEERS